MFEFALLRWQRCWAFLSISQSFVFHFLRTLCLALYPTILILLWCCWSGDSKRLPKQNRLLLLLSISPQKSKVNSCYQGHNSLWIKNLEESSWIWPKSLFPEDVLLSSRRCYAICQGRKEISSPTQLWQPWTTTAIRKARYPESARVAFLSWW